MYFLTYIYMSVFPSFSSVFCISSGCCGIYIFHCLWSISPRHSLNVVFDSLVMDPQAASAPCCGEQFKACPLTGVCGNLCGRYPGESLLGTLSFTWHSQMTPKMCSNSALLHPRCLWVPVSAFSPALGVIWLLFLDFTCK